MDANSMQSFVNQIIRNSKGITFICYDRVWWCQEPFNTKELRKKVSEDCSEFMDKDVFMSMQSFKPGKKRTTNRLAELRTVYMDLDYYTIPQFASADIQTVQNRVQEILKENDIPEPSFKISSGKGMYLVWLIDIHSARWLTVWKFIMHQFYRVFAQVGADSKSLDCSRVLRLPQSFNGKGPTQQEVRCLRPVPGKNAAVYSLKALYDKAKKIALLNKVQAQDIPAFEPEKQRERPQYNAAFSSMNPPSLKSYYHHALRIARIQMDRVMDLQTLFRMRQEKSVGTRELTLFYMNVSLRRAGFNDEERLRILTESNNLLPCPLPQREVMAVRLSCTAYMPSNAVILRQLKITPEEQKSMRTLFDKKEKARRRSEAQNQSGMSNSDRQQQFATRIASLVVQGVSVSKIAAQLKCSRQTIYNYFQRFGFNTPDSATKFLELYKTGDKMQPTKTRNSKRKHLVPKPQRKSEKRLRIIAESIHSATAFFSHALKKHVYTFGSLQVAPLVKIAFDPTLQHTIVEAGLRKKQGSYEILQC